jgi:hypothetical protein
MKSKQYMQTRHFFACFVCTIACLEVEPALQSFTELKLLLYTAETVTCYPVA